MFDQPIITIFCAFTRLNMVDQWLADLEALDVDPEKTNLVFLVDGASKDSDDPDKEAKLIYLKLKGHMDHHQYRNWHIHVNEDHYVNDVNIPIRRRRIAEIKEQSKDLIAIFDSEYVLSLEDDTVFSNALFSTLLQPFKLYDNVGLVSGYEAGRWFQKMLGVWCFDDVNDPTKCWTMLPDKDEFYEPIDAAGFYFYLTPTKLYLEHVYHTEPWEPWGPDVNYGLELRQKGYINFVDWSTPLGHNIFPHGIITPDSNLAFEYFVKTGHNQWERVRQPERANGRKITRSR